MWLTIFHVLYLTAGAGVGTCSCALIMGEVHFLTANDLL